MADSDRLPVGTSPVDGPADALVTIVEFGDARDFFTARAEPTLLAIRARYGNNVRIVWKTHPHAMLDPNGARTAEALMAAHAQGRFWEMLQRMEERPTVSTDAEFDALARGAGLDLERFHREIANHAHRAAVDADARLSRSLGGPDITPIFYVNGTRLVGAHPIERFVPLIDASLAAARAITPRERAYAEVVRNPAIDPEGTPVPGPDDSHTIDPTARYRVPLDGAPARGRPDALVTLVGFEDFECPACAQAEPILTELRERYPNDLRVVWRNLPLWVHPNAMLAAEAGRAVFALGGHDAFWRFHDTLYSHAGQEGWLAREALETAAAPLGIEMQRFRAMLDLHETHAAVHDDLLMAARFGIRATPGFFINGRMVTGVQPIERFVRIIESARDEARALVASGTPANEVYDRLTHDGATIVRYLPRAVACGESEHDARYPIPEPHDVPVRGPDHARVTIVWYGEFTSLASSRLWQTLQTVMERHPADVRLVWRDLPAGAQSPAMAAAEAAREVFAQQGNNGFWRYHATLLANQRALAPADLERYAAAQRINVNRLRASMSSHSHAAAIRADRLALDDLGLRGDAPLLFVQGRMMGPTANEEAIERVVAAAIAEHP